MRSADLALLRRAALGIGALGLTACTLSGCVSTQTKNARTVLVNNRTIASESAVKVTVQNPQVTVQSAVLVGADASGKGAAVVVTVQNTLAHPVSDLPISAGIRTRSGKLIYLNHRANAPYFDSHLPAIAAHASATWVLTLNHAPAQSGRPFAVVGTAKLPASTTATSLPALKITGTAAGSGLDVSVSNGSSIPQYGLPVYAVATRDGRAVGAASGTITELDGGDRTHLDLHLIGSATGAALSLSAPPTIFH